MKFYTMGKTAIEGVELALLQKFIETGRTDEMPEELLVYLNELEVVRGHLQRFANKDATIKLLKLPPYNLSYKQALSRYSDAINFFYIDNETKRDAWRGLYAERLDRIALAMLKAAKTVSDWEKAANVLNKAAEIRGVFDEEPEALPDELFVKPIHIYTTDISHLGHERINRKELARMIDSYKIDEVSRKRIKQEAMLEDPQFLTDGEATR